MDNKDRLIAEILKTGNQLPESKLRTLSIKNLNTLLSLRRWTAEKKKQG